MVTATLQDYNGEFMGMLQFPAKERLDRHTFRILQLFVADQSYVKQGYKLSFNLRIETSCSLLNLYIDYIPMDYGIYCSMIRRPFGRTLQYASLRRMQ